MELRSHDKNICRTKRLNYNGDAGFGEPPILKDQAMIDLKTIETELNHARLARLDAEAASTDVEDMIRHVQHFEPGRGRLCFYVAGLEAEPLGPAN